VTDRIAGKVAQILNRRELVITAGSDQGVEPGMKFAVLNPKGAEIHDPETGEVLGSVEVPKVLVEAVRIQPRLSVARTFVTKRSNVGGSGSSLASMLFQPPKWVEEVETLKLSDKPFEEDLDERESYVKIGDPVIQVIGDEFTNPNG